MAIKDPYLIEQENRQPETSPPTMASVGEVDYANGGLTLIFPGADGPSSKRYQCNTAVKFVPGQRVKIDPMSGSFVAAYPIGPPAEKIVADAADSIGGYSPKADAETGALYFVDKDNTAVAVLYAQTAQQANTALEAEMALDSQKLNGQTAEELEVARALEADTALEAERAKDADKLGGKTEAQLSVAGAKTSDRAAGSSTTDFKLNAIDTAYTHAPDNTHFELHVGDQRLDWVVSAGYWWFYPSTNGLHNLGTSANRWLNAYFTNQPNVGSDKRLKKSISGKLGKYLALHKLLRPVSYLLRNKAETDNHDRRHIGFVAQDVQAAMETAGLTAEEFGGFCRDENGYMSLRYGEFVALNTAAIQALAKTVAEQKEQINTLAARLAALEAKHEQTDL